LNVADRVVVTTNGALLDEAAALRTLESGLDYLRVSVYGTTADGHRRVTGSKIPPERIFDNIARLKRLRDERGLRNPVIYAKMIDPMDAEEEARFLARYAEATDEASIEPAMNWNLSEVEADLSRLGAAVTQSQYFRHRKSACSFPFYTLVINADLRVTVCCVDWEKATVVGDLSRQSLREIWHGAALREFQLTHLRGERHTLSACRSCTYLHTAPDDLSALSAPEFASRLAASEPDQAV
jgi:MoaA/NifB/PqqE/SkfB family radical SAM enzyme